MTDDTPTDPSIRRARYRQRHSSLTEEDIERIAERVEQTGSHKAIPSTPPMVRWLQKFWWQTSIALLTDHVLHELLRPIVRAWLK